MNSFCIFDLVRNTMPINTQIIMNNRQNLTPALNQINQKKKEKNCIEGT